MASAGRMSLIHRAPPGVRRLAHRAWTALRAASVRCFDGGAAVRTRPPFLPPLRPISERSARALLRSLTTPHYQSLASTVNHVVISLSSRPWLDDDTRPGSEVDGVCLCNTPPRKTESPGRLIIKRPGRPRPSMRVAGGRARQYSRGSGRCVSHDRRDKPGVLSTLGSRARWCRETYRVLAWRNKQATSSSPMSPLRVSCPPPR